MRRGHRRIFTVISLAVSAILLIGLPLCAYAHKVNIFAYVEGDMVYTESYFPDGKKVEGGIIEVYDSQGNKILEGLTDREGQFKFKIPKKDDLKIILNATMGHKNSYILSADELSDIYSEENQQRVKPGDSRTQGAVQVSPEQLRGIIDDSLQRQLRPLIRQLSKMNQDRISFTEVIGGIGYIFGVMGIIFYFLNQRRKE